MRAGNSVLYYSFVTIILLLFSYYSPLQAQEVNSFTKLVGNDTTADDWLARTVAIYGNTAVLGARFNSTDGTRSGAVYVYERNQGGTGAWGQTKRIASPFGADGWFGQAVDIDQNYILVGAKNAKRAALYFRHAGGQNNWGLVKTFAPPADDGEYGHEVVVHGDTVVISEIWNTDFERVYIYYKDEGGEGNWGLVKTLVNEDTYSDYEDLYGYDIALDGDILVVAENLDVTPTGVHIYYRNKDGEDNWGLVKQWGFFDHIFGFWIHSVDVYGDRIVAGSRWLEFAAVLRKDLGGEDNWGIEGEFYPPDFEGFGQAVSLFGGILMISSTGSPPNQGQSQAGAGIVPANGIPDPILVRIYERTGKGQGDQGPWETVTELTYPETSANGFGVGLEHSFNKTAVFGAFHDSELGHNAGAAYIYKIAEDTGTVKINIHPKAARDAGARWQFTFAAEDNWRQSGDAAEGVTGNATIKFNNVAGYIKPNRVELSVECGDFYEIDVFYLERSLPEGMGTLTVNLDPRWPRVEGALWRIKGDDCWHPGGAAIQLPEGSYRIETTRIDDFRKPRTTRVEILAGEETTLNLEYTFKGY